MAQEEGVVDIYGWTWQMRKDRVNMIQTVVSGLHGARQLAFKLLIGSRVIR